LALASLCAFGRAVIVARRGASIDQSSQPLVVAACDSGPHGMRPDVTEAESRVTAQTVALERACREAADDLTVRLSLGSPTIVRAPFVVAGDLDAADLESWYSTTIGPATRTMARRYFDSPPDEPITVLLFSDKDSYERHSRLLYADQGISKYGYYIPHLRTLVMNIGTGAGTLVHELTHALIDFDFPDVPDWFNEGLASLHEQCRIRDNESGIDGLPSWRLPGLQKTLRLGRLRSLEALLRDDDFRGQHVGLNYAHARYLCLFLQSERNPRGCDVLGELYRELRAGQDRDPQGVDALQRVFRGQSWAELDAAFRAFVLSLTAQPAKTCGPCPRSQTVPEELQNTRCAAYGPHHPP
jgi:hypothetical protein